MSIFGTIAVVAVVLGITKENFNVVTTGMFIGLITVIIGTATSVKRELIKEIRRLSKEE
jgi:hypothetical protein